MIPERIKRVEREIQRTLADILRAMKDPRLAAVNITDVTISKDLRTARVFISTLVPDEREEVLAAANKAAGWIGHRLGEELDLRRIPRMTFEFDPSLVQGAKIDAILARVLPPDSEESDSSEEAA